MRYLLLILTLFLVGCDSWFGVPRGLPPGGTGAGSIGVGTILGTIATFAAWIGGTILVLAPVAFVASFFIVFLKPFQTLIIELGACAFILTASAMGLLWLSNNVWILVLLLGLCGLFLVVRYYDIIIKLLAPLFIRRALRTKKPTPV